MTHASLFNGIGGFQLAAQWAGWENVMSCEINQVLNKLTKKHYPNCFQYEDIRKADFTIWRNRIDVLTGGFPCQPFSVAGKRKGTEDDRHLWPEMLRSIREIRPRWVVGENVRGFTNWNDGVVFDQVLSDLEDEGYETQSFILPAAGVNAPHRRDRVWIVAYSASNNDRGSERKFHKKDGRPIGEMLSTPCGTGSRYDSEGFAENPLGLRRDGRVGKEEPGERGFRQPGAGADEWVQADADASRSGIQRHRAAWEQITSASVGSGLPGRDGARIDWSDWPTEPGLRERNDGLPEGVARRFVLDSPGEAVREEEVERLISQAATAARIESIMGYGNAIVPQVARRIFTAINNHEGGR